MTYPAFTSLSEVVIHLNAIGPDGNSNYTVYGLPVSSAIVQAHVDHANKYIYSLVPDLAGDLNDPRYITAELAALDIACLSVLVSAVGGSVVGATNYSLADLNVSRAGPSAYAVKTAIDGFQRSATTNLQNVASVATSAKASAAARVPRYSGPELSP